MVIKNTIIDTKGNLVGFRMSGTEREFGGNTPNTIELNVPVAQVANLRIDNKQVETVNGNLVEKGTFKIRDLRALMINGDQFVNVDNKMSISVRVLDKETGDLVGFVVNMPSGEKVGLKVNQMAQMSKWLVPSNFVVRFTDNGPVIAGKPGGVNVDDMPTQYISLSKSKAVKVSTRENVANSSKVEVKQPTKIVRNGSSDMDIIDFIGAISDDHGFLVMASSKDNSYNSSDAVANGESNRQREANGFRQLRVGEISRAKLNYNPVTLNVNADFKKIGTVDVNGKNVPCYAPSKKTLFRAGVNNMNKVIAMVDNSCYGEFISKLGTNVDIKEVPDELGANISKAAMVIGETNTAVRGVLVDGKQLNVMNDKKVKCNVLKEVDIAYMVGELFTYKVIAKALNSRTGLVKEAIKGFGTKMVAESTGREVAPIYRKYDDEMIASIREAGIDPYTGAFTFKVDESDKTVAAKAVRSEHDIEIEYTIEVNGLLLDINKFRANDIAKDLVNIDNYIGIPQYHKALMIISRVFDSSNVRELVSEANRLASVAQSEVDKINFSLWVHNTAMTIAGNTEFIHSHDGSDWLDDVNGRAKKYSQYVYSRKINGDTVLKLKTLGVTIPRS